MQTIEFLRPVASHPSHCTRPVADALSRNADDPIESGFLATLLAMAGHDLRQPLQVITSAHDVLATMLRDKEQQEELARAGDATGQLARMLSQLIDALQLQERPRENLRAPVLLRPILDDLVAEFDDPAHGPKAVVPLVQALRSALRQLESYAAGAEESLARR